MHSCIYEGLVTHSRFQPLRHRFQYRLYMLYLDLDELPGLVGPGRLISDRRFANRSFLAADHLSGDRSIAAQLRQWIGEHSGQLPTGKIRLLTQLRYFGYYFSPLNLFYVFDSADQQVECVVAEVNNTPWGERHCYLLWQGNRTDDNRLQFRHRKQLHVSPFMGMDMHYHWRLGLPGERLNVVLENHQPGQGKLFTAAMTLRKHELSRRHLRRMAWRYPWMTAHIITAIHFQAFRLWWKKCPVYPHPQNHVSSTQPSHLNRAVR